MTTKNSVRCTATGRQRSWLKEAWLSGDAYCPDCGGKVEVWVRGTDLFPHGKAKAHPVPDGVIPAPYAVHRSGGPGVS